MTQKMTCLQMLLMLKARGFMKREELAKELNCNVRVISKYRQQLEEMGYEITATTGKYGGYTLERGALLPVVGYSKEEARALQEARQYMKGHQDFQMLEEFERALDKLQSTLSSSNEQTSVYMELHTPLSKRVLKMIRECELAKHTQHVIELKYRSLRSSMVESVRVHPYEILNYKQAYYCLGYSLKAKDYRIFKFSDERMKACQVLDMTFQRDQDFKLKEHIGKSGLVKDACFEIELYVYHESAVVVAEKTIGIDDKKTWINENTLHLQTIMEGKVDTITFLLSLKDQCTLIAPQNLKEEMFVLLESMKGAYSHTM